MTGFVWDMAIRNDDPGLFAKCAAWEAMEVLGVTHLQTADGRTISLGNMPGSAFRDAEYWIGGEYLYGRHGDEPWTRARMLRVEPGR